MMTLAAIRSPHRLRHSALDVHTATRQFGPIHALQEAAGLPYHRSMKKLLHWAVFIALALQLISCVFLGETHMPGAPF